MFTVVELDEGAKQEVSLADGSRATVALVSVSETVDGLRGAVRSASVAVKINGEQTEMAAGNYALPVMAGGLLVDCPVTSRYRANGNQDNPWGLRGRVRLRLWPAGAPAFEPGSFMYPVRQRIYATSTQIANEPTHVNGGESVSQKKIYYHAPLDFGGVDGMDEVVAATDATIICLGEHVLPGYEKIVRTRYDLVYTLDKRGWSYRYSHLDSINPALELGQGVKMGERIGILGKEGASGGWAHLHFGIHCKYPNGLDGVVEGYVFAVEAYRREHGLTLAAVARPHHFLKSGDAVVLDGSRSWCTSGDIRSYTWTFADHSTDDGMRVRREYPEPGAYSEMLTVTDDQGNISHDFCTVLVTDSTHPDRKLPCIHAAYHPSLDVRPGMEITCKVRSFNHAPEGETIDWGDGSASVTVKSDGNKDSHAKPGYAAATHAYARPGNYIVRVEQVDAYGVKAMQRLWIPVEAG